MTAAVIDPNNGATPVVLFGSPVILGLVILAGVARLR